jgi:AcrR family transcriptional regulator
MFHTNLLCIALTNNWLIHLFMIMPRTRTPGLQRRLLDAAVEVFSRAGYRQGRIEDVARAARVSPATVHLYARTKEALFDLAVRHALLDATALTEPVPYAAPPASELIERLWQRLREVAHFPALEGAGADVPAMGAVAELEAIVREGYRWQLRHYRGVLLVERCAREWPELAALFYREFRRTVIARLTAHLDRRMAQGALRRVPDTGLAARVIVETIAWFAMHRHRAPDSVMDDAAAEAAVVDFVVNALAPR